MHLYLVSSTRTCCNNSTGIPSHFAGDNCSRGRNGKVQQVENRQKISDSQLSIVGFSCYTWSRIV
jgi:hypothetical protein